MFTVQLHQTKGPLTHFAITSTYLLPPFAFFPLAVAPAFLGPGPPSKSSKSFAPLNPVGGRLGGALPGALGGNGTPAAGGPAPAPIPAPGVGGPLPPPIAGLGGKVGGPILAPMGGPALGGGGVAFAALAAFSSGVAFGLTHFLVSGS